MANSAHGQVTIARWHAYLLLAASLLTCLLITMGGVVCVTESGAACPDWPGCYGRAVPPLQINSIIEYTHRFIAALTSPLIIAAAVAGLWKARSIRWVSRPPLFAIPFLIAVIIFGALAVLRGLTPGWAAADLGSALIVLALLVTATVAAWARRANPAPWPDRLAARTGFTQLTLGAGAAVYVVLVSAVLVAGKGSLTRCLGWPMWRVLAVDVPGWPQPARLLVAVAACVLLAAVVVQAWRRPQGPGVRLTATLVGLLFVAELFVGALGLVAGFSVAMLLLYVVLAAGLWASLVVLAVLAGIAEAGQEAEVGRAAGGRAGEVRDVTAAGGLDGVITPT